MGLPLETSWKSPLVQNPADSLLACAGYIDYRSLTMTLIAGLFPDSGQNAGDCLNIFGSEYPENYILLHKPIQTLQPSLHIGATTS